jgi:hypothetical protein
MVDENPLADYKLKFLIPEKDSDGTRLVLNACFVNEKTGETLTKEMAISDFVGDTPFELADSIESWAHALRKPTSL